MYITSLAFYMLIFIIRKSYSIDYNFNKNQIQLNEYVHEIIKKHCQICTMILTIQKDYTYITDLFVKVSYATVKLNNNFTTENLVYDRKADMTIIFVKNNSDDIEYIIYGVEELAIWNMHGKFVVVIENGSEVTNTWIEKIFLAFWERQILKVLLCFYQNGFKLFTYNPFFNKFVIDISENTGNLKLYDETISNMNGYPIKTYFFDFVFQKRITYNDGILYGMDGMFLDTVGKALNAQIEIHRITEDFSIDILASTVPNEMFMEYIETLATAYDFDALSNAIRIYEYNKMRHVFMFERNDMFVTVPKGKMIPSQLYLFMIVEFHVWCVVILSYLLVSFIMAFIDKLNYSNTFLNIYRIMLNESPPTMIISNKNRLIYLPWVQHCLVLTTLFQSSLMGTLMIPKYYSDINSVSDLLKTDLKIYAAEVIFADLATALKDENQKLLDRMIVIPNKEISFGESMDWAFEYMENNGVILSQEYVNQLQTTSMKNKIHVIQESLLPNVLGYNIRTNKNYFEEMQDILLRIQESGLFEYWKKNNFNLGDNPMASYDNMTITTKNSNQKLKLEHLHGALILLAVGYCLAIISFVVEILCHIINKK